MSSVLKPALIALIYAAALEPDFFHPLIEVIRDAVDVDSVGVFLVEQGQLVGLSVTQDVAESMPAYLAYYHKLDPWGAGAAPRPVNKAYLANEFVDEESTLKGEFYNDFGIRYGMLRPLGIVLDVEPGLTATLSLNRLASKRLLSEEDKPLVSELGIHLRTALRLNRRIVRDRAADAWHLSAFDLLQFGVVICTADGKVQYANRAARELESARAGLVLGNPTTGLQALNRQDADSLQRVIRAASNGRPGGMRLTGGDGVALSVLAAPFAPQGGVSGKLGNVLLSLRRADAFSSTSPGLLTQLFGLSPTQAVLCTLLAAGHTFEEAAGARGIAISTARAHFRAILLKTKARNLRDLLRLLASLPHVDGQPPTST